MQEFILIPEVPMIVRKIAPDGHHCAYWSTSSGWSTESIHTQSQTVLVTFKEQTDVR